jgi:hypothetical protein
MFLNIFIEAAYKNQEMFLGTKLLTLGTKLFLFFIFEYLNNCTFNFILI